MTQNFYSETIVVSVADNIGNIGNILVTMPVNEFYPRIALNSAFCDGLTIETVAFVMPD